MSEQVVVKLADGSQRTGRWVTLEEWMAPLDKDHPARKELHALRTNLGAAMANIDKLERDNASLHQQFREELAKHEQEKQNEPPLPEPRRPKRKGNVAVSDGGALQRIKSKYEPQRSTAPTQPRTLLPGSQTHLDSGDLPEQEGPAAAPDK